jgi:hypothetical protein
MSIDGAFVVTAWSSMPSNASAVPKRPGPYAGPNRSAVLRWPELSLAVVLPGGSSNA